MYILRYLEASYRLFKTIPGIIKGNDKKLTVEDLKELEREYNVMILRYGVDEILGMHEEFKQLLRMITLSNSDMKKTLFQDLSIVRDNEELARILTGMHYFSTYGRELLGINRDVLPTITFNNYNDEETPNYTTVLHVMSPMLFMDIVLSYLSNKNRYSQDELEDMIVVLDNLLDHYPEFVDKLKNITITSNDIRAYLMYNGALPIDKLDDLKKVVGKIVLRKNIVTNSDFSKEVDIDTVDINMELLNNILAGNLTMVNVANYAKDFNRNKKFMIFLKRLCKKLYGDNNNYTTIINRISKLSKKLHVPIKEPLYKKLTAVINDVSIEAIMDEIGRLEEEKDGLVKLSKLYLAINYRLRTRSDNKIPFLYRIRNGKQWFTLKDIGKWDDEKLLDVLILLGDAIESIIINRLIKEQAVLDIPSSVLLATPYSKNNVGSIPTGTTVSYGSNDAIIGIYWENIKDGKNECVVDLDLSMTNVENKIGWDGDYSNAGIVFSGDMTDAADGATELFYLNNVSNGLYRLNVNWFNMNDCDKNELEYKFFISTIDRIKELKSTHDVSKLINLNMNKALDIVKKVDNSELVFFTMLKQYEEELRLGILNLNEREFIFSRSIGNSVSSYIKDSIEVNPVEVEYNMLKAQFKLTPQIISDINNLVIQALVNKISDEQISIKKLGFYEACKLLTQNM